MKFLYIAFILLSLFGLIACSNNSSPNPTLFKAQHYGISVQLPFGWAAAEGLEMVALKDIYGVVAFNSWGQSDFWEKAIETDHSDGSRSFEYGPTEVASQIPDEGAYVALINVEGPPGDPTPKNYSPDDLSGLYQPHDWRLDTYDYAYFKDFHKGGADLTLVVTCSRNATDETVNQVNELLKSWKFHNFKVD